MTTKILTAHVPLSLAKKIDQIARRMERSRNWMNEPGMLDTNTISHLIKAHPAVARCVVGTHMSSLCISAITEGELFLGWRSAQKQSGSTWLYASFCCE